MYAPGTNMIAAAAIKTFAAVLSKSTATAASMQAEPRPQSTGPT